MKNHDLNHKTLIMATLKNSNIIIVLSYSVFIEKIILITLWINK